MVKLKDGGRASRYVVEVLEPGVSMTMKGPFGVFTIRPEPALDLLLVGTGTGIAPYRAHLVDLLPQGEKRRIDILYGVRTEEDLFWRETFEGFARQHPNVFLHMTLSQPTDAWKGHRGRVQALLPRLAPDLKDKCLYLCGNPDMIKELKALAAAQGVAKGQVHGEGFI